MPLRRCLMTSARYVPWGSSACQLRVQSSKDGNHRAAVTEGELQSASRMDMDQPRDQVHQLLHHGADASALGAMTWRGIRAEQAVRAYSTNPG
jgi:hypothetical protein